jgi:hypothetical protein
MTPLHHGQYVHLDVLPNGDLRITLTEEGMYEALNNASEHATDDDILSDLMEDIVCNGGPQFTTADKVPGNLSEAPMLLEDAEFIGEPGYDYLWEAHGRTWCWADYQIISILEHIKRQGEAVLTLLR